MSSPLHVLMVEDSEDDAFLIVHALQRSGFVLDFERVETPEAFSAALARQSWDVVIADYSLPRFSGLAALKLLHESGLDLPFIVVSGTIGEEAAVALMKAGAHDYIMKDNQARLGPAVRRELDEAQVRTARRQAEDVLRRRNRELALLNRASQAFGASLDLDQVLATVLEEARHLMDVAACSIWLVDAATGELVCRQASGPRSELVIGWRLAPGDGLAGWVVAKGESLIVADVQADQRHFQDLDRLTGLELRSILSAPLQIQQKVIGVLQMVDFEVDRFEASDLTILESLAATAAIAIENARLYAAEQQRAAALARALEQQQELDRLKNHFIQNVSHELRTPLALIQGYAELLNAGEMGELQPALQDAVSVIARRARMLGKMADDLVAILETEKREPKRESLDLANLMLKLLADFQVAAEQAGLSLTAQIADDLPPVSGDAQHLLRVMDNLLGNALKFTPVGGQISVRLWRDGPQAVLEVADTGIGIPPDQLERVFERFYQVDGSTTRRYGGTGLGLALVKEIVEAHGGQVSVSSQVGQGSTFTVRLPL
jgi:signal transduction histidine kinase/DNA-binding response OmpR family regulator